MSKVIVSLYIAAVLGLVASGVAIWRLRCEGFGCMGVGIAWFAWVAAFFVILGVGLFARSRAAAGRRMLLAARLAAWLQLGVGVLAVAVWLVKHAS